LIPTRTAVDVCIVVSQGAGRGDSGWKQMWTSHEWGDHERWRCLFSFFFFFLSHVLVVKYKKQHGALAMAETKL